MEKCGKFIAWLDADTIEKSENVTSTISWNYAVDLDWQPEEEKNHLNLQWNKSLKSLTQKE